MWCRMLVAVAVVGCVAQATTSAEESGAFYMKAAKSVPRIGKRGSKNNADFEKFFLKASKSVPRIGRRNEVRFFLALNPFRPNAQSLTPVASLATNLVVQSESFSLILFSFSDPTWSEIAERYEYDPELFSSPELLARLEEELGDDPSAYNWDKVRIKRGVSSKFLSRLRSSSKQKNN
ncbi:hypothetical protein NQ318_005439 [Aromia moschata]|uniref:Uncharacterized protein n=1 Tax=Aromia moschata TaxID=1265417 RepID=A0AAV8YXG6_9CUCU|nr:hypothetical protein NQ318_005439 [Aromia moschata]